MIMTDVGTRAIVHRFNTVQDASVALGVSTARLRRACAHGTLVDGMECAWERRT